MQYDDADYLPNDVLYDYSYDDEGNRTEQQAFKFLERITALASYSNLDEQYATGRKGFAANADATWNFTSSLDLEVGKSYRLLVTWADDAQNTSTARYEVLNGSTVIATFSVDQKDSPGLYCPWTRRITQLLNPNCCAR